MYDCIFAGWIEWLGISHSGHGKEISLAQMPDLPGRAYDQRMRNRSIDIVDRNDPRYSIGPNEIAPDLPWAEINSHSNMAGKIHHANQSMGKPAFSAQGGADNDLSGGQPSHLQRAFGRLQILSYW